MVITTIKDFTSNKYVKEFDSKVDAIERKVTPSIRKFYQDNYFKGVQNFLDTGTTGYDNLFRIEDITNKYQQLYVDIGLHIAKWYFRSFEKYHKKADSKPFTPKWTNAFSTYGSLIAAYNAPLVSGTAKTTLIKLTSRLMKDPDFMRLGEREKGRILRKNFRQYSDYQARRLVRTESTRASNYAIEESSKTMFSEDQLSKQWVTMGDARVRNWHQSVNGQTRRMGEPFLVNGEEIMRPGEGSAKNTVNCRCRMITIPDEGAVPITEISDIGVGIGESRIPSFSLETITNTVVTNISTGEVVEELSQKEKMTPDNWSKAKGGATIDDDYLELLDDKLSVNLLTGKKTSYQSGNSVYINTTRYGKKMRGQILAHEVGHAIHTQRGWITLKRYGRNGFEPAKTHPLIQDLYKKHREYFGANLRGAKRIEFQKKFIEKFYSAKSRDYKDYAKYVLNKDRVRKQFPKLSDKEFSEYWGAMCDYIGATTKNQIGWGHSMRYYRNEQWQKYEMFAHMMENKYHGNPVFKKLLPDVYDDTIDTLNKLIREFKSTKP